MIKMLLAMCLLALTTGADAPVIHVALGGFEAHADAYYAQELGLYKRAGLNVDIQQIGGGAAIIAGIVGGAVQIGAGNPLPLANAKEHGFDLVLIAPGFLSDVTLPPAGALVVAAKSPARSGKDLNGKTVAVNTLHSVDQIAVQSWVDQTGGDSSSVKFTEVPNPTMIDAVTDGRVDAALVADPAMSTGLESGLVRNLANANTAIAKRFMVTGWFASRGWADANPDAARRFATAIDQASAWAVANPQAAALLLKKYMRLSYTRAHENHASSLDPALLQPLFDAAVRYKVLAQPLDARSIIWPRSAR